MKSAVELQRELDDLSLVVESLKKDLDKAVLKENAAAGRRVRAGLRDVRARADLLKHALLAFCKKAE